MQEEVAQLRATIADREQSIANLEALLRQCDVEIQRLRSEQRPERTSPTQEFTGEIGRLLPSSEGVTLVRTLSAEATNPAAKRVSKERNTGRRKYRRDHLTPEMAVAVKGEVARVLADGQSLPLPQLLKRVSLEFSLDSAQLASILNRDFKLPDGLFERTGRTERNNGILVGLRTRRSAT